MNARLLMIAGATATAVSLVLSGCAGGVGGGNTVVMEINNPRQPLVPGDTTESEGTQIVTSLWTPLVTYNLETSEMEFEGVAESIQTTDSINYTVKLKEGWEFHDGSPVTSDSFIKAWNYSANPSNAFQGAQFFEFIKGYDGLEAAGDANAEMEGLVKVDDTTFTVELSAPFGQWPLLTGYNAYYPLPEAFFADPEAFGKKPIGNGPFKAGTEFVENEGITLVKNGDYSGPNPAKINKLEFRIFSELNTAYRNVQSGEIDISRVPPASLVTVESEFGNRFVSRETSGFTYLGLPMYDPRFQDKRARQAFSLAVDRQAVANAVFNGARTPAQSVVPPLIPGARSDACNYCDFDPDQAKALLAESGFDTSKPVDIWFNAGAGHDQWVQAIANQLKQNLGVEYRLRGDMQFAEYLQNMDDKQMTGPFRMGWLMDYPSMQNFLEPLFTTTAQPPAGSNSTYYSNPEFDAAVEAGNQAAQISESITEYQKAEDILLEDMPVIPLFFERRQYVHSERVTSLKVDGFGIVRTELLQMP